MFKQVTNVTLVQNLCKQVNVNGKLVATITLSDNTVWELTSDNVIDFDDFSYIDVDGDTQTEVHDMLKVWAWQQL